MSIEAQPAVIAATLTERSELRSASCIIVYFNEKCWSTLSPESVVRIQIIEGETAASTVFLYKQAMKLGRLPMSAAGVEELGRRLRDMLATERILASQ